MGTPTFVFPYYLQMVNALAENGIISVLHFDQSWTRDLERFREFPAKMCVLNPDGMTDVRKAKELVGGRMSIMGDVPAQHFASVPGLCYIAGESSVGISASASVEVRPWPFHLSSTTALS